ncbi:MAG: RidA family protein [Dongiaceae bacterium]
METTGMPTSKTTTKGKKVYPHKLDFISAAIRAGDFVFVSGQLALGPDGNLLHGNIEQETRTVLRQIETTLKDAGCTMRDIIKVMVWLQDPRDFEEYNRVYKEFFPVDPPVRATVRADLIYDSKLEVQVTAYKPLQ